MPVTYLDYALPGVPHVRCAFQTRCGVVHPQGFQGGNIAFGLGDDPAQVADTRRCLLERLRPQGLTAWAELRQVHGDVLRFDPPGVSVETEPVLEGDGMATARPGLGLCIRTADCQPILLAHVRGGHIAALHVGWRGNRCDFPVTAVERFCERYGLAAHELVAVRGPSLGPGRAEFVNFDREWGPAYLPWFDAQTRTMDLWGLTRYQLERAGLRSRHIYGLDLCTFENRQFFSYRRHRGTGRQASLIWIDTVRP